MTNTQGTHAHIIETLTKTFQPDRLELIDDSHLHRGHPGAPPGGNSHFRLTIVARAFEGHPPIRRHRMVTGALNHLMPTPVHALSITALTPEEDAPQPA